MKSFKNAKSQLLTVMIQTPSTDYAMDIIKNTINTGAEAYGLQTCLLEDRSERTFKSIIEAMEDKPCYVTNYRGHVNSGKDDEAIAEDMIRFAKWGGTLIDVMGDMYDKTKGEFTESDTAIQKQMQLIDKIHTRGAEVLMSSHVLEYTDPERVLEIALGHKKRGADISKIVVGASTMEEQLENMKTADLLRRELGIPFLFLSGGECKLLRRLGGELGCCMCLCVHKHHEHSTKAQPLLDDIKKIRALF